MSEHLAESVALTIEDAKEHGNLKAMPRSRHIQETLKNPDVAKHKLEQTSKASKRRWNQFRQKRLEQYDTYYWETA